MRVTLVLDINWYTARDISLHIALDFSLDIALDFSLDIALDFSLHTALDFPFPTSPPISTIFGLSPHCAHGVVNCGMKNNQIRCLAMRGAAMKGLHLQPGGR